MHWLDRSFAASFHLRKTRRDTLGGFLAPVHLAVGSALLLQTRDMGSTSRAQHCHHTTNEVAKAV
eukprot:4992636-Amphidinium_carterae.1